MNPRLMVLFICLLFSCGRGIVYDNYMPVKDSWDKTAEYRFDFDITDKSVPYDITIQIRNNNTYPYQNIWLLCEELHGDNIVDKDTIEYMLADDFGKWKGNGITLFQSHITLKDNYFFPDTGKFAIKIRHGMRNDFLRGIEDIGLLVALKKETNKNF
ncbi:MAG: gliding motility lipoprotein GldH [Tannerella sp.]|nr:gliding motility lipoprotein GldH [Tannerella sp.]